MLETFADLLCNTLNVIEKLFVTWLATVLAILTVLGLLGLIFSSMAHHNPDALRDFAYGVGRILGMPAD